MNKYNKKNNEQITIKDFAPTDIVAKPDRTATFIISSEVQDDDNEVINIESCNISSVQSGSRNVCWANHEYNCEAAIIKSCEKIGKNIIATISYPERPNDLPMTESWSPDLYYAKTKAGFYKASVDFISLERREPTKRDLEMYGEDVECIHSKTKLLGFSLVSMPANESAQMLAVKALKEGKIDKKDLSLLGIKEEDMPKEDETPVVCSKPLPTPNDGQSKEDFMSACMLNLNDEYPDEAQRAAICYAQWGEKNKEEDKVETCEEDNEEVMDKECDNQEENKEECKPEDKECDNEEDKEEENVEDKPVEEKNLHTKSIIKPNINNVKRIDPDIVKKQIEHGVRKRLAQLKGQIWID